MKILTGDRPTGALHLGHYVGSLLNRLTMQYDHDQYIIIADLQALTDNFDKSDLLEDNIYRVFASYLAIGLKPEKNKFFLQSLIPELSELTVFFMNLVSVERLKRNPTIKEEIKLRGFTKNLNVGFFTYPISQAADILLFHAEGIPVGSDQLPMIEQANEVVTSFNHVYNTDYFKLCHAILSDNKRLVGVDGKNKMSKSLKNAIFLSDSEEELYNQVMKMYTDLNHIKISDPGKVEGNVVFTYLDIFDSEKEELILLKDHYRKGGLGDVTLKKRLFTILNNFLLPIRDRYYHYINDKKKLKKLLLDSTEVVRSEAIKNIEHIKKIMKITF